MKLLKDLLYNKGNTALDIARLSALMAVIFFLGLATAKFVVNRDIDLIEFGTAWGLICTGCGGWIFARQTKETD